MALFDRISEDADRRVERRERTGALEGCASVGARGPFPRVADSCLNRSTERQRSSGPRRNGGDVGTNRRSGEISRPLADRKPEGRKRIRSRQSRGGFEENRAGGRSELNDK